MTLEEIQTIMGGRIENGSVKCLCPYHQDTNPSLNITIKEGKLLWYCFVCGRLADLPQLTKLSSAPPPLREKRKFDWESIVASYKYYSLGGHLVLEKLRDAQKNFLHRAFDAQGQPYYQDTTKGKDIPLYNIIQVMQQPTKVVHICEGEKDCDTLTNLQQLAVTNHDGADGWRDRYAWLLLGRAVIIHQDNDRAGWERTQKIISTLHGVANIQKIVTYEELPDKSDLTDFYNAFGPDALIRKIVS